MNNSNSNNDGSISDSQRLSDKKKNIYCILLTAFLIIVPFITSFGIIVGLNYFGIEDTMPSSKHNQNNGYGLQYFSGSSYGNAESTFYIAIESNLTSEEAHDLFSSIMYYKPSRMVVKLDSSEEDYFVYVVHMAYWDNSESDPFDVLSGRIISGDLVFSDNGIHYVSRDPLISSVQVCTPGFKGETCREFDVELANQRTSISIIQVTMESSTTPSVMKSLLADLIWSDNERVSIIDADSSSTQFTFTIEYWNNSEAEPFGKYVSRIHAGDPRFSDAGVVSMYQASSGISATVCERGYKGENCEIFSIELLADAPSFSRMNVLLKKANSSSNVEYMLSKLIWYDVDRIETISAMGGNLESSTQFTVDIEYWSNTENDPFTKFLIGTQEGDIRYSDFGIISITLESNGNIAIVCPPGYKGEDCDEHDPDLLVRGPVYSVIEVVLSKAKSVSKVVTLLGDLIWYKPERIEIIEFDASVSSSTRFTARIEYWNSSEMNPFTKYRSRILQGDPRFFDSSVVSMYEVDSETMATVCERGYKGENCEVYDVELLVDGPSFSVIEVILSLPNSSSNIEQSLSELIWYDPERIQVVSFGGDNPDSATQFTVEIEFWSNTENDPFTKFQVGIHQGDIRYSDANIVSIYHESTETIATVCEPGYRGEHCDDYAPLLLVRGPKYSVIDVFFSKVTSVSKVVSLLGDLIWYEPRRISVVEFDGTSASSKGFTVQIEFWNNTEIDPFLMFQGRIHAGDPRFFDNSMLSMYQESSDTTVTVCQRGYKGQNCEIYDIDLLVDGPSFSLIDVVLASANSSFNVEKMLSSLIWYDVDRIQVVSYSGNDPDSATEFSVEIEYWSNTENDPFNKLVIGIHEGDVRYSENKIVTVSQESSGITATVCEAGYRGELCDDHAPDLLVKDVSHSLIDIKFSAFKSNSKVISVMSELIWYDPLRISIIESNNGVDFSVSVQFWSHSEIDPFTKYQTRIHNGDPRFFDDSVVSMYQQSTDTLVTVCPRGYKGADCSEYSEQLLVDAPSFSVVTVLLSSPSSSSAIEHTLADLIWYSVDRIQVVSHSGYDPESSTSFVVEIEFWSNSENDPFGKFLVGIHEGDSRYYDAAIISLYQESTGTTATVCNPGYMGENCDIYDVVLLVQGPTLSEIQVVFSRSKSVTKVISLMSQFIWYQPSRIAVTLFDGTTTSSEIFTVQVEYWSNSEVDPFNKYHLRIVDGDPRFYDDDVVSMKQLSTGTIATVCERGYKGETCSEYAEELLVDGPSYSVVTVSLSLPTSSANIELYLSDLIWYAQDRIQVVSYTGNNPDSSTEFVVEMEYWSNSENDPFTKLVVGIHEGDIRYSERSIISVYQESSGTTATVCEVGYRGELCDEYAPDISVHEASFSEIVVVFSQSMEGENIPLIMAELIWYEEQRISIVNTNPYFTVYLVKIEYWMNSEVDPINKYADRILEGDTRYIEQKVLKIRQDSTAREYTVCPSGNKGENCDECVVDLVEFSPISTVASIVGPNDHQMNFPDAFHKIMLNYFAFRSGNYRPRLMGWRSDSCDDCWGPNGEDLRGGHYEAGGSGLKIAQPSCYTAATLGWGLLEFPEGYAHAEETGMVLETIRWELEYWMNAHSKPKQFVAMFGHMNADFSYPGPPEFFAQYQGSRRGSGETIRASNPASEILAECGAAMSVGYIIFKDRDPTFADELMVHAEQLYSWANSTRAPAAQASGIGTHNYLYRSRSMMDELIWGSIWMYKATSQEKYLETARDLYFEHYPYTAGWAFSWDNKIPALHLLMADVDRDCARNYRYHQNAQKFLDRWIPGAKRTIFHTTNGLAFRDGFGTTKYAANTAFIAFTYAKMLRRDGIGEEYANAIFKYGQSQIEYIMGKNGFSFIVGVGNNYPGFPFHRTPYNHFLRFAPNGKSMNQMMNEMRSDPNRNSVIAYGYMIGGPESNEKIVDSRSNWVKCENALDYNAALSGALAALVETYGGDPVDNCGLDLGWQIPGAAARDVPCDFKFQN